MSYTIKEIEKITSGKLVQFYQECAIDHLLSDSRKVYAPSSLFFALHGPRRDGHQFISDLYKKGIRNFIISRDIDLELFPEANVIVVPDVLFALQQIASAHRQQFAMPVIGITGSNGKTIVKEWLYQLLHEDYNIVRNPKSYNSQIGVPLSVWQMSRQHSLGIFEAGISQPGEMKRLEKIIQPSVGILTNIGEAHSEGFTSSTQKLSEKTKLFIHCDKIIYCKDYTVSEQLDMEGAHRDLFKNDVVFYSWSRQFPAWLSVSAIERGEERSVVRAKKEGKELVFDIPFTDDASIENAITVCCTMLALGIDFAVIRQRLMQLQPVNMRLEMRKGINHCAIINDSYSADLSSLKIALNFLDQQSAGNKRTVILSDFLQSNLPDETLYSQVADDLFTHRIEKIICIGNKSAQYLSFSTAGYQPAIEYYFSTEEFIQQFRSSHFKEETILIKGARVFQFERIVQLLEQKVHETVLEINLNAIAHNLKEYQKLLKPETKLMAMVKAFAYGSGGAEIAGVLQYHKVDYFGVAYTDEGVELRKAGITLPIMVMNPEESSFDAIIDHNLEPVIYSLESYNTLKKYFEKEGISQYPVHMEVETGMNRLGLPLVEVEEFAEHLAISSTLKVQTVFSHLAASEDRNENIFTAQQHHRFITACDILKSKLPYNFIRHISNSAAITSHPELEMDMVRLGIGLYGIDSANTNELDLLPVATLKSTIAQIKYLKKGETVSYNRRGVLDRDSLIATVRIGYADGYSRRLGNGVGKMLVNGLQAPVVGTVCMDMTMIDITDIPGVDENDEVIIFGKNLPVQQLATWSGTIPYEIMTGISQRVKRVYFEE